MKFGTISLINKLFCEVKEKEFLMNAAGLMGREGSAFNNPNFIPPTHVHIAVWRSVSIQGATMGFVQPNWDWSNSRIPWEFRLYY